LRIASSYFFGQCTKVLSTSVLVFRDARAFNGEKKLTLLKPHFRYFAKITAHQFVAKKFCLLDNFFTISRFLRVASGSGTPTLLGHDAVFLSFWAFSVFSAINFGILQRAPLISLSPTFLPPPEFSLISRDLHIASGPGSKHLHLRTTRVSFFLL